MFKTPLSFSLIILALIIQPSMATGFKNPRHEARFHFNRGKTKLKLEDWSGAIQDFNHVLVLFPNQYQAYNLKAIARLMQGDKYTALSDYKTSLLIKPNQIKIYLHKGMLNTAINFPLFPNETELIAINDDFKKHMSSRKNSTIFNNLGVINYLLGDSETALRHFNRANKINKKSALSHFNKSLLEYRNHSFDSALKSLRLAIKNDNLNAPAYNIRGNIFSVQGHYTEGLLSYDKAIEINNQCAAYYYNRGNINAGQFH
jgi:tetratricopeptide (TPR) repeat protein